MWAGRRRVGGELPRLSTSILFLPPQNMLYATAARSASSAEVFTQPSPAVGRAVAHVLASSTRTITTSCAPVAIAHCPGPATSSPNIVRYRDQSRAAHLARIDHSDDHRFPFPDAAAVAGTNARRLIGAAATISAIGAGVAVRCLALTICTFDSNGYRRQHLVMHAFAAHGGTIGELLSFEIAPRQPVRPTIGWPVRRRGGPAAASK